MIVESKDLTIVGETNFRTMRKKFGIKRDDRRRHVYIIGKSGSGKSVLLENMIIQDIKNGNGCCVMDPHGDMAEKMINFIPNERINDVVYFNPADIDFPIAFNVFEGAQSDSSKNLVASGLIGIFKKMWADSWGPRLEYVLRNTIISLMYDENATLLGINKMFIDKNYRMSVVEKIKDPVVKAFWLQEYEQYPAKELPMIISPIQNKVGQFLSNSLVRNILGQVKSTLDLRDIMDKKKILLVNLAKGRIGEDNSSLIGSMLVTKLYLAAMSRIDLLEEDRSDFYLYVDEFQNFATESFADILSEARKYRLSLTLAHQYITQLPEIVSDAVFGNGGTLIAFRVGPQDAEIFEKEFAPDFVLEDLVNIPKWNVVLKILIDGVASKAFSASTLPPLHFEEGSKGLGLKIIEMSRKKYARNRVDVERAISEATLDFDPKRNNEKMIQEQRRDMPKRDQSSANVAQEKKVPEKMYDANCWVCGIKMNVPFVPDNKRPIYCVDCLKKIREKLIPEPVSNKFVREEKKEINKEINTIDNSKTNLNNKVIGDVIIPKKEELRKIDNSQNKKQDIRKNNQVSNNKEVNHQNAAFQAKAREENKKIEPKIIKEEIKKTNKAIDVVENKDLKKIHISDIDTFIKKEENKNNNNVNNKEIKDVVLDNKNVLIENKEVNTEKSILEKKDEDLKDVIMNIAKDMGKDDHIHTTNKSIKNVNKGFIEETKTEKNNIKTISLNDLKTKETFKL